MKYNKNKLAWGCNQPEITVVKSQVQTYVLILLNKDVYWGDRLYQEGIFQEHFNVTVLKNLKRLKRNRELCHSNSSLFLVIIGMPM